MIKTNGKITENNCFGEKSGNIQTMSPTPLCTDLLGTLASYQRKPVVVSLFFISFNKHPWRLICFLMEDLNKIIMHERQRP